MHLPETLADWRAFAAHAIWTATFLHSWVGGNQMMDGGNVQLAPIGMRCPGIVPESTDYETIAPPPQLAGFQIALAELIGHHGGGKLALAKMERDPHEGTYAKLLAALRESEGRAPEKLLARAREVAPFELDDVRARINV